MSVQDESSLSRMRTLQFNDKMSTLNRDFLKSLRIWYEQCPHYDFSDTVGSYLKHVAGLEKQYGLKTEDEQENGVTDENRPLKENGGDRKIAKARRRLPKDSSKLNDSVAVSTPARVPPRFSLGNVSAIAPTETPEMAPMEPPSTQGGRKRVIRGGGPNNERESVHFRGSDASANTIEVPPVTIQLPKPSAGFWDKHKDESHQGTMPRFNIVKPAAEVLPPGLEKNDESPFAFGKADTKKVEPAKVEEVAKKETESVEKPKATSPILFGSKTSSEPAKPGFSFGNFNTSKTESADAAASKPAVSFPVFGAKKEGEDSKPFQFGSLGGDEKKKEESVKPTTITFPTFGAKKDDQPAGGDKPPTLTFPTFGSGAAPKLALGASPALTFGAKPPAAGGLTFGSVAPATEENKEDEEGEYVPPKAEVVENEEPGASYSVKCSVFKMVDKKFEKMGIGMMHLKETDGKKSVLIRAANTMGTVWVNALINATMKIAKADEKGEKMRLTVPLSASEMGIFLVRFPNVASAEKVQQHVEENSK